MGLKTIPYFNRVNVSGGCSISWAWGIYKLRVTKDEVTREKQCYGQNWRKEFFLVYDMSLCTEVDTKTARRQDFCAKISDNARPEA